MSTLSRRAFLGRAAGLAALTAAGCSPLVEHLTQPTLPQTLQWPSGRQSQPVVHLLNRATYGPRLGQVEQVAAIGHAAWIEQQLDYEHLPDDAVTLRLRRYDTLHLKAADLHSFGWDERYIAGELSAMMLTRAVYSERQLHERMVGFWSDHFSIYAFKDDVIFLKTVDDREVIRPHALGTFRDLLFASAHSPAMLRYLDNTLNQQGHPNENYAREIMELHTLGVKGGYTERDVKEVARCLTGWTMTPNGEFTFRADWHDSDEKTVLGQTIPAGGGQDDGERVLSILADHPSTRRFVSTKLVRRFVADDPPVALVDDCVRVWESTGGDMRSIIRALLNHPEFEAAPPKFKRPFDLVVSLLRAIGASYNGDPRMVDVLTRLGQRPFGWPRPDGYPDTAEQWQGNLLDRWNFCADVFDGHLPGVTIDLSDIAARGSVGNGFLPLLRLFGRVFLSRDLTAAEETALMQYAANTDDQTRLPETLALLIAGPAFQLR